MSNKKAPIALLKKPGCSCGGGCQGNDAANGNADDTADGNANGHGNGHTVGPNAKDVAQADQFSGAVLVCGGGIAGIQASLDLSAAGYRVYLVEESPTIGGGMARLDKTFPTGDCATCIISPKLVECIRDYNIDVYTMSDVTRLDGEAGHFKAEVRKRPRSIDASKCTGCGDCWQACPVQNVPQPTTPFVPSESLDAKDAAWVDQILARYQGDPAPLIPILQDINDERHYLPRTILEHVSARLDIPMSEILRVASFYNAFSLKPVGRHVIEVCLGTACFVRGSGMLLERLESELGIKEGGTDKDGRFTLRTVRCIGCCALAPAMRIGDITFGRVKLDKVSEILEQFA
jgi:NADH:ubiquinone oxidoreductase subunit E/NAD-dependent dihydropyrimidine dehydrogenase PreA subunit